MTGNPKDKSKPAIRIPAHAVGVCVLGALTILGWSGVLRPWVNAASAEMRSMQDAESMNREADALLAKANAATQRSASMRRAAEEAASLLYPQDSQNERFAAFSRTAAQHHLAIREMVQDAPRRESRVVRVHFRVVGDGSYSDVAVMLDTLATELPDFAVRSLTLLGNADKPAPTAQFTFEAVWFGKPADLPLSAPPVAVSPRG